MKPFFIWVSIPLEVTLKIPQENSVEKITVDTNQTIGSLISKLGYNHDTVVVLYKDQPIPETTTITENMDLTMLEITSKG